MPKRFVSLFSLCVLLGLVMLPFGPRTQAAKSTTITPKTTTKDQPQKTKPQFKAAELEVDDPNPATYIVRLEGEPLATYRGTLPNLPATNPRVTGDAKLNQRTAASQAYRSYLGQQRQRVTSAIGVLLGAKPDVLYTYDVAYNGLALKLNTAQAAQVRQLPGVVSVNRAQTLSLHTDVGPTLIRANQVWNGTATNLYLATILGANETPPVNSPASGKATLSFNPQTLALSYNVQLTDNITPTAAHLHRGGPYIAGPVIQGLTRVNNNPRQYAGSITLSAGDAALLLQDGLYLNFHTAAFPGGEIRGQVTGSKGEGILVGIIDTGVNFSHPSFAARSQDGYTHVNPLGAGNYKGACDPTRAPVSDTNPSGYNASLICNAKLVGAWTWPETRGSAPGYNNNSPNDDDGHGSHTASTAAGNVITSTLLSDVNFGRISGVAPHANIIAYDACNTGAGCPEGALIASINQAVSDTVDVINYSIGGGSVSPWLSDNSVAFLNAREAGVFVATSAGNSGSDESTLGAPGNAPWVTAVGATEHNRAFIGQLTGLTNAQGVTLPNIIGKSFTASYSTHPIVFAGAAPYNNPFCYPFPAGTFNGEIVVCDRGGPAGAPGRVAKGENVLAAGGGGYILINNLPNGDSVSADAHVLPAVHIGFNAGTQLKAWLATGTGHVAAINGRTMTTNSPYTDLIAAFSSRGPDLTNGGVIKPDVVAPGVDIIAAVKNDPTTPEPEYGLISGTSMASPHTAGAAALVASLHPNWTPAQIQSALMTTAEIPGIRLDATTLANPFQRGSGRLDLSRAVRAGLVLGETRANYLAANPASGGNPSTLNIPSFQGSNCIARCTWTRVLSNTLGVAATWTAAITNTSGMTLSVTPATFTIPANGQQTITVRAYSTAGISQTYLYGNITLIEANNQAPQANFPVATRFVNGSLPSIVNITTRRSIGSQQSGDITSIDITNLTPRSYGLIRATPQRIGLPVDPTNGDPYDDLTVTGGIYLKTITVPAGTKRLVTEILAATASDVDVYLHRDGANGGVVDGIPSDDEVICESATSAATEFCSVLNPVPGTYIMLIQNWEGNTNGVDDIDLATTVVPPTSAGNLTVTGPTSVPASTPFKVTLNWNLPGSQANDRWYGAFDLGSDAANAGNIGTIPVNLRRLPDEVSVTKSVTPLNPAAGNVVTYTLVISNMDTISHTVTLSDVLPSGITYVPGSVTGAGATYNAGTNSINVTALFDKSRAPNYSYEDNLMNPNLGAASPFGGFIDLTGPDVGLPATPLAGNNAASFDTQCPLNFYDIAGGTPTRLGFSTNGLFLPRGTNGGVNLSSPITTTIPSAITPNRFIAGFWGDMSIGADNGFTTVGYTGASLGTTCTSKVYIVQLTNLHTKTNSNPTTNALNVQVVYDFADPDVYWVLYDNVRGPLRGGVIGVENATGTLGLQYLYDTQPANHRPANGRVIRYYRPLIATPPLTITFQAIVDGDTPCTVTNTAQYMVAGSPELKTASATFNNSAAACPTATATALPTETNTPLPTRTSTATASTTPTASATRTASVTPTASNTAVATMTSTASATSVPPTNTNTATSIPPTASNTATNVPPTVTNTSVPPTMTSTPTRTNSPTRTASPTRTPAAAVGIANFAFQPSNVTINVGESVRWTNNGSTPHTSTSLDKLWDSGTLTEGQSFSFTFNTPGQYAYFCSIHPSMTGVVTVRDPNAATATPSPTRTSVASPTATRTAVPTFKLFIPLMQR